MSTDLPKEPLRGIFADLSGLPASRVLWDGEAKGFAGKTDSGKSGHVVLTCIATRRVGVDEELRDYDVEASPGVFVTRITFSGQRVRTVTVRAENYEGEEGFDLIESIRLMLGSDAICARLNAASLSLNGDEATVNLGATADNRTVKFAAFDVMLNHFVTRVVDVDPTAGESDTYIDAVEIEGQDDLAVAGTDTIGPP